MTKEDISALLGRPLTPTEETNFDLYIDIAKTNLETLICTPVDEVSETRVFDTREGYTTLFTDIFWNVEEVKINGEAVTNYSSRQWNKRDADWYNSLVFTSPFTECQSEVEITADWGFTPSSDASSLPYDLQSVLAGLFAQITKRNKTDQTIQSKQVEDFRISFNTNINLDQAFYDTYGLILSKYSLCDIPNLQHGGC